jgi:RNA polymerase sigma-54 factor
MRLDTFQQLRLEQKLKLAPRMIQSMEILQLSILALEERIDQELEKNPVLELREADQDTPDANSNPDETAEVADDERELVVHEDNSNQDDFERLDNIENVIDPLEMTDRPVRRAAFDEEDPKQQALTNTAAREISLHEYLTLQWDLTEADPLIKQCGEFIINHLDPDGYFRTSFSELAKKFGQEIPEITWEQAIQLVQTLDPPGIAARTVQECLLLQLEALGEDRCLEHLIISDCFDELQKQQYTRIAQRTNRPLARVKEAVDFIGSRLILHPGLTIGSPKAPHIVPDVIIDYNETGPGYTISVPERGLPHLYVSGHYRRLLQTDSLDRNTRQFIKKNIQSGQWLIEAIEQRRHTLKRVTEAIVDVQTEFLESGPRFLKPLPMAQIADKIGVHVATVSRAVSGKFLQTPRGIYPLRMFFSGGTETTGGESLSWDAVRAKIQDIIDAENKTKPLSDDQIVEGLKQQGIDLARRTVTKYRKMMGVASSHRRRES